MAKQFTVDGIKVINTIYGSWERVTEGINIAIREHEKQQKVEGVKKIELLPFVCGEFGSVQNKINELVEAVNKLNNKK